ncbi:MULTISPECIES: class II fructose-bisphosphatase [Pseudonocardia]|nr:MULTISPECIES: class II fructose-bisphosphatase [Pseudonocardia]
MRDDTSSAGKSAPDRNLALELVRVTEAAAMATGRWVGRNDTHGAVAAAIHAMRVMLGTVEMVGTIVIGEGPEDDPASLLPGETVGDGTGLAYDVALDPVDGISFTAKGLSNAISMLCVAPRGAMLNPRAYAQVDRIVGGRESQGLLDVRVPIRENVIALAKARSCHASDITVGMLARPHHEQLAREVREAGARIRFLTTGDVTAAFLAASAGSGIDLMVGRSSLTDSVIAACAVKALGGTLQACAEPRDDRERAPLESNEVEPGQVLTADDLVRGEDAFFVLTGITDGELVRGVRYVHDAAHTESIITRARSGTVRRMQSVHQLDRLARFSSVDYQP